MQRLIPGKTKVRIELFRGVTLADIIIGVVAMAMLVFVMLSTIPGKLWICLGIASVAVVLLVRLDEQPNYVYLLHILTFFGFDRKFGRRRTDRDLLGASADAAEAAEAPVQPMTKAERKKEDKLLASASTPEDVKASIRERREKESREAAVRMASARERAKKRRDMGGIIAFTGIADGFIEYLNKSYYGAVLEIPPVEFRFFSEHRRQNSIEACLGRVLRSIPAGYSANIVKLERPIIYDGYLQAEYRKVDELRRTYENGFLSEEELKPRVDIEYDRIAELQSLCGNGRVTAPFYYLVLFDSDKRHLDIQIRDAEQALLSGEMQPRRLNDKELAVFLKYSNGIDFDEHDIDRIAPEDYVDWARPETVDVRVRCVEVNHVKTHIMRVVNYPSAVDDAWLASVMSYPATKVVVKCRPMDRAKAIRAIDHSLIELRGQWSNTGVDSRRMEIESHISTLQELLATLQSDSESLLECSIYISAYDIVATRNDRTMFQPPVSELPTINNLKKNVRRTWQENGFRLNNMEFDQVLGFIGSQVNAYDPLPKESRGISSNTVAACFPWVFAHISDEGGVRLGESDGIPVFINFFRRDSERVNSNMVIVGKSGSGKSYAAKSLLANLSAEDSKIFILDPENEYTELARNLRGQVINVGNAAYGRLNPFHIITSLEDDEKGAGGAGSSYSTHLQFLEEFFKQIMPDCGKDAMEYLNTLIDRVYLTHNITPNTDLSSLRPEDYPIFDDLYDEVLREFQSSDNPFTRDLLRTLMNYIAKFSTGGRNANIWNGPSTVTTNENFTVFNFQSMLANRNSTIANAQMLLVLKYLDNEIIKNRDYNLRFRAARKIIIVIDEAHVFIDSKFPIALDFMFQLAKRIRKYNGMQIVITQNIKDFVGSEELARKSTAIINACQYSFIFALAPNDMQDLVKLYEKAGGINESEQEQIIQAPRGQAFAIMSPSSRSTFRIETDGSISDMFENRDRISPYFEGIGGEENWEEFISESRAVHDENMESGGSGSGDGEGGSAGGGIVFREFDEDEYEAGDDEPAGAVTFDEQDDERIDEVARARREAMTESISGGGMTEMIGLFATAVNKMTEAIDSMGGAEQPVQARAAAAAPAVPVLPPDDGRMDELIAKLAEQQAEIERLRAENERIKQDAKPAWQELSAEEPAESFGEQAADLFSGLFDAEEPEAPAGDLAEGAQEDASAQEDEDDDIMSSFFSFANEVRSMTLYERMRLDGVVVENITFDELEELVRTLAEKKRRVTIEADDPFRGFEI